jgi:hypothetical protein
MDAKLNLLLQETNPHVRRAILGSFTPDERKIIFSGRKNIVFAHHKDLDWKVYVYALIQNAEEYVEPEDNGTAYGNDAVRETA